MVSLCDCSSIQWAVDGSSVGSPCRSRVFTLGVVQQLPGLKHSSGAAGSDVSLGFTPRTAASASGATDSDTFAGAAAASRIPEPSGTHLDCAPDGSEQPAGYAAASRLPLFRAHPVLKTLAAAKRAMELTPGAGALEHVMQIFHPLMARKSSPLAQHLLSDHVQQSACV